MFCGWARGTDRGRILGGALERADEGRENDLWEEKKKSRNQSGHGEAIVLTNIIKNASENEKVRMVWSDFRWARTSSSPQRPLPAWLHGGGAAAETWKNRQECRQSESHGPGPGTAEGRHLTTPQRRGRRWSPGRPRRTKPARSPDPDYFGYPGLHLRGRIKRLMVPVVRSSF